MNGWHLAQFNVARLHAPTDDPMIADFMNGLDEINALAEAQPGYVWRLQSDIGNATDIHPYEDEMVITNMSVWESVEEFSDFVYRTGHVEYLRRKREWFEKHVQAHLVMWWIPAGELPTLDDAVARLEMLRADGPGPNAFTPRETFPPPP